ncbi:pantetheine-phosphate adenylyltransferase [Brucepastera parasyntrophica]|uniref:pantetheine-phosphate adenylyltransferase n=1 Tax=Brucepastera parasyntrophica TaxID=2880008 RepID=UPI00210C5CB2|nr:pantetheine-phosphate adenylyltransferase [Brucepastera parasyntrophica]ULQ59969.1 pantetheine-phosphate adenylyltransferase [Brucepastera parasyntrophica]
MVKAVFAGSFDPPTYGHYNIIERARSIFNEVHVVVAVNKEKKYLFSEEERLALLTEIVSPWPNVSVRSWDNLIVKYAQEQGAKVLIRGVRNFADFSYEFDLALLNRSLNPDIDTVFMSTDPDYFVLRSSAIKELAALGGDVSSMVPEPVAKALYAKYG